jgi:DNA topoisomerase-1
MSNLLSELQSDAKAKARPVAEKVKLYNECNREVAILCNHKRTVGAGHEQQMEKLADKIKAVQYKAWRVKHMILDLEPKQKKKKGAGWFEIEGGITEEWIKDHQAQLVEQEREKIRKKFEKDNEKRAADKEKPLPEKELKERLKAADEMGAKFKKENKSKKVEAEGRGATVEKLEAQIEKLEGQITNLKAQAEDREGNKEVALGTSKIVSLHFGQ